MLANWGVELAAGEAARAGARGHRDRARAGAQGRGAPQQPDLRVGPLGGPRDRGGPAGRGARAARARGRGRARRRGSRAARRWSSRRPAEKHADAGRWEEALAAAAPGLAQARGRSRSRSSTKYRAGLYLRWFRRGDPRRSVSSRPPSVLEKGLAAQPGRGGARQQRGLPRAGVGARRGGEDPAKALGHAARAAHALRRDPGRRGGGRQPRAPRRLRDDRGGALAGGARGARTGEGPARQARGRASTTRSTSSTTGPRSA